MTARNWRIGAVLALLAGCSPVLTGGPEEGAVTAFTGRVIDGTGAAPVERGVVLVQGERIRCVGTATRCPIPRGARVVDAGEGTILPGLIDLHAHVWDAPMLAMFLPAGVTTVRDLHNTLENLATLDAAPTPAPRLYRSGPLVDGQQRWPGSVVVSTPEGARRAVDSLAAAGVDLLKLYNGLPEAQYRAAATRAVELGLPITTDLFGSRVDALQALEMGVRGFEHGGGLSQAYRRLGGDPDRFPLDAALVDSIARTLIRADAYVVPTLIVQHQYAAAEMPSLEGVPLADRVPEHVRGFWAGRERVPQELRHSFAHGERFTAEFIRRFVELGGRVGAGSDLPNPYVTPGGALHQELELMVGAGLTPLQAIHAATGGAAEILGNDEIGVLAAGRLADLVVVDGNPAADIRETRGVRHVVRGGEMPSMDSLLALAPPSRVERARAVAEPAPPADGSRLRTGTFAYRVLLGGNPSGTDTLTVRRDGDTLVVEQRVRTPVFSRGGASRFAFPSLAPRSTEGWQEAGGSRVGFDIRFGDGRAKGALSIPTPDGVREQPLDVELPSGGQDINALWTVLAALPLETGVAWEIPVLAGVGVASARVEVGAMEPVQVGGASVPAYRVEVEVPGMQYRVWISEAAPRWIVATELPAFSYRTVAEELPR